MSDRKPNSILSDIWTYTINNPFITTHHPENALLQIEELENVIWQAKETLRALAAKQKTWEAREASQEVQLEQESSTHSNDQRLPEKEQSQRTTKQSDISPSHLIAPMPMCTLVKTVHNLNGMYIYSLVYPEPLMDIAKELLTQVIEGGPMQIVPSFMELEIAKI